MAEGWCLKTVTFCDAVFGHAFLMGFSELDQGMRIQTDTKTASETDSETENEKHTEQSTKTDQDEHRDKHRD